MTALRCTLALLLACFAPTALAASATADAFPEQAAPGEALTLVYTVDITALAEVAVLETATCTLAGPDGASGPCGTTDSLVDVRVQGGQRAYTFRLDAPTALGAYTATFTRGGAIALSVPPDDDTAATVAFEVVELPLTPQETPAVPDDDGDDAPIGPASEPTQLLVNGSPDEGPDGLRWIGSLWMASGATVAAVVVARRGGV
ncbi:MAG TPA: hypothetical protein VM370_06295 [Candidatus Thermoplasmatota archaeon]|nr:hypothetical protein [Candidatus Thermoplasmatota archaeon]